MQRFHNDITDILLADKYDNHVKVVSSRTFHDVQSIRCSFTVHLSLVFKNQTVTKSTLVEFLSKLTGSFQIFYITIEEQEYRLLYYFFREMASFI